MFKWSSTDQEKEDAIRKYNLAHPLPPPPPVIPPTPEEIELAHRTAIVDGKPFVFKYRWLAGFMRWLDDGENEKRLTYSLVGAIFMFIFCLFILPGIGMAILLIVGFGLYLYFHDYDAPPPTKEDMIAGTALYLYMTRDKDNKK
jgi:hypothetical protein